MITKQDYSRLLDDEFLNAGERVRVVTRGAASILGSSTPSLSPRALSCCRVLLGCLLAVGLFLLLFSITVLGIVLFSPRPQVGNYNVMSPRTSLGREAALAASGGHDDGQVAHDGPRQNAVPYVDHNLALAGGFHDPAGLGSHPGHLHEHVNPGDVLLEDHHIVDAESVEPREHVLLLCLPTLPDNAKTTVKNLTKSKEGAKNKTTTMLPSLQHQLHLSRAQTDAVHSAAEYLADKAVCHLVVLRGLDASSSSSSPSSSSSSASSPPQQEALEGLGLIGNEHPGCGSPSDEEGDVDIGDVVGVVPGGDLVLSNGRALPVVLWDAGQLFNRSRLGAVPGADWRWLDRHRASAGSNLLDLAARLLLLWRFGGISVDVNASADNVLKTMSALNRSDTSHVYLETTRATVIAAPQTCNAVIFELITTIAKHMKGLTQGDRTNVTAKVEEHEHYDVDDVQVFDDVLNAFCRDQHPHRGRRRVPDVESSSVSSSVGGSTKSKPIPSALSSSSSSSSSPSPNPRDVVVIHASGIALPLPRTIFKRLREEPAVPEPATRTTTPDPDEVRVDKTRCRGNLIAISLD